MESFRWKEEIIEGDGCNIKAEIIDVPVQNHHCVDTLLNQLHFHSDHYVDPLLNELLEEINVRSSFCASFVSNTEDEVTLEALGKFSDTNNSEELTSSGSHGDGGNLLQVIRIPSVALPLSSEYPQLSQQKVGYEEHQLEIGLKYFNSDKNSIVCNPSIAYNKNLQLDKSETAASEEVKICKEEKFQCETCQKTFKSKSLLSGHLLVYSHEKKFQCVICKERFNLKCHLDSHLIIHPNANNFKCTVCQERFQTITYLSTHLLTHPRKQFQCDICQEKFGIQSCLKEHVEMTHGKFKCNICQMQFLNEYHFNHHLTTHSNYSKFQCRICEEKFHLGTDLCTHLQTHSQYSKYPCGVCQRGFLTKYHLTRHLLSHSQDKAFQCGICQKRFKHSEYVKLHIKVHHTGK